MLKISAKNLSPLWTMIFSGDIQDVSIEYYYYPASLSNAINQAVVAGCNVTLIDTALEEETTLFAEDRRRILKTFVANITSNKQGKLVYTKPHEELIFPDQSISERRVLNKAIYEIQDSNWAYHNGKEKLAKENTTTALWTNLENNLTPLLPELSDIINNELYRYDGQVTHKMCKDMSYTEIGRRLYWLYELNLPSSDEEARKTGLQVVTYIAYGIDPCCQKVKSVYVIGNGTIRVAELELEQ